MGASQNKEHSAGESQAAAALRDGNFREQVQFPICQTKFSTAGEVRHEQAPLAAHFLIIEYGQETRAGTGVEGLIGIGSARIRLPRPGNRQG
jgi:hypothetical protein